MNELRSMQSIMYGGYPTHHHAPSVAAALHQQTPSIADDSDDDDVFVDIDGDGSDCDCDAGSLSSTSNWSYDVIDAVSATSNANQLHPVIGNREKSTGSGAIFSLALFASSVQLETATTRTAELPSIGKKVTLASQRSQPCPPSSRIRNERRSHQRRAQSLSPRSPSASESSAGGPVSPSFGIDSLTDEESGTFSSRTALHRNATSVACMRACSDVISHHPDVEHSSAFHHLVVRRHPCQPQQPSAKAEVLPTNGRALTKSARCSFLIEEILRPEFGVRRQSQPDVANILAPQQGHRMQHRNLHPPRQAGVLRSAELRQPVLHIIKGDEVAADNSMYYLERLAQQCDVVDDPAAAVSGARKASLDSKTSRSSASAINDSVSGQNGDSIEPIQSSFKRRRVENCSPRSVNSFSSGTSRACPTLFSLSGGTPSDETSGKDTALSPVTAVSAPNSVASDGSLMAAGKLQLPAWVFCTRYSDRPSSGPRSRKTNKRKQQSCPSTTDPDATGLPTDARVSKTIAAVGTTTPSLATSSSSAAASCDDKRPRTAFNADQLAVLRVEFETDRYLTEDRRRRLADQLGLHESQIKIWFQNKRAKLKKASGVPNPLAMELAAQGLYNHSTVSKDDVIAGGNNSDSAASTNSSSSS